MGGLARHCSTWGSSRTFHDPRESKPLLSAACGSPAATSARGLRPRCLAIGDAFARDGVGGRAPRIQGAVGLHHAPRAKRVVWLFMAGAPSQFELYEPKPILQKLDGQPLPPSLAAGRRFAFIDPARSKLLGTRRKFQRHGESGAPVSELLPHIGGIADKLCFLRGVQGKEINHGPAKLFMNTGHGLFGRPSCGESTDWDRLRPSWFRRAPIRPAVRGAARCLGSWLPSVLLWRHPVRQRRSRPRPGRRRGSGRASRDDQAHPGARQADR